LHHRQGDCDKVMSNGFSIFTPGIGLGMELSKNVLAGQVSIGMKGADPELHFRYKYYVASVYYSLPLVGFYSRGTGVKIGMGF